MEEVKQLHSKKKSNNNNNLKTKKEYDAQWPKTKHSQPPHPHLNQTWMLTRSLRGSAKYSLPHNHTSSRKMYLINPCRLALSVIKHHDLLHLLPESIFNTLHSPLVVSFTGHHERSCPICKLHPSWTMWTKCSIISFIGRQRCTPPPTLTHLIFPKSWPEVCQY